MNAHDMFDFRKFLHRLSLVLSCIAGGCAGLSLSFYPDIRACYWVLLAIYFSLMAWWSKWEAVRLEAKAKPQASTDETGNQQEDYVRGI